MFSDRIAQRPGEGSFVFSKLTAADEGVYQCEATNDNGTAISEKITLQQTCKFLTKFFWLLLFLNLQVRFPFVLTPFLRPWVHIRIGLRCVQNHPAVTLRGWGIRLWSRWEYFYQQQPPAGTVVDDSLIRGSLGKQLDGGLVSGMTTPIYHRTKRKRIGFFFNREIEA